MQVASGEAPPQSRGVTFVSPTQSEDAPFAAEARAVVIEALIRHGYSIAADAPDRIELGISQRHASLEIDTKDGVAMAPALHRGFLQTCGHTAYRLTLSYFRADATVAAGHAAVDEAQCHGSWAKQLPALAEALVSTIGNTAPPAG